MSKQDGSVDSNEIRTFYDPHPGLKGALYQIPIDVRMVAKELNGKTMTLGKAIAKIRAVTSGKVELVTKFNYISLDIVISGTRNLYRVIRYK